MATTQLFVELLIIGVGALAALLIFGAAVLGYEPTSALLELLSTKALIPGLSVAYVLGIVTDRIADRVFGRLDTRYREEFFPEDGRGYYTARRTLLIHGAKLWDHLEYGRSRLRICRGWAFNTILLLVAIDALAFIRPSPMTEPLWKVYACNLFLAALGISCTACWRELARKEYQKIERQSDWIEKQQQHEGGIDAQEI